MDSAELDRVMRALGAEAVIASAVLARASRAAKDAALTEAAALLRQQLPEILQANALDMEAARARQLSGALTDRLMLNAARWRLSESLRIDNLANRAYVGSVIVNESNQRYFEPAPGRVWSLMVNAQFH